MCANEEMFRLREKNNKRRKMNKTKDKMIDKDVKIHARLEEKDRRD
jgi:hypothetical protein